MFRVVNVSKRAVTVGGVRINPLETHIFNKSELSQSAMDRITGLVNIGVLKMYEADEIEESTASKKGKRK